MPADIITELEESCRSLAESYPPYAASYQKIQQLPQLLRRISPDQDITSLVAAANQVIASIQEIVESSDTSLPTQAMRQLLKDGYPVMREATTRLFQEEVSLAQKLLEGSPDDVQLNLAKEILQLIDIRDLLDDDTQVPLRNLMVVRDQLRGKGIIIDSVENAKLLEFQAAAVAFNTSLTAITRSPPAISKSEFLNAKIALHQKKLALVQFYNLDPMFEVKATVHYIEALWEKFNLPAATISEESSRLRADIEQISTQYSTLVQNLYDRFTTQLLTALQQSPLSPQLLAQIITDSITLFNLTACYKSFGTKKEDPMGSDQAVAMLDSVLAKKESMCASITEENMQVLYNYIVSPSIPGKIQCGLTQIFSVINLTRQKSEKKGIITDATKPLTASSVKHSQTSFWKSRWVRLAIALVVITVASVITGGLALGLFTLAGIGLAGTALIAANASAIVLNTTTELVILKKIMLDPEDKPHIQTDSTARIMKITDGVSTPGKETPISGQQKAPATPPPSPNPADQAATPTITPPP